jgi:hypothetical protein
LVQAGIGLGHSPGKWIFFAHFTSDEFNQSNRPRPSEELFQSTRGTS